MTIPKAQELLFLPDVDFASESGARIQVIRSLAGRARHLYELASGTNPVLTGPSATPRNPRGMIGWDLSGPPWGSALRHPIAWVSGRVAHGDVQGERQVAILQPSGLPGVIGPWRIWNRPHDRLGAPRVAPYSRGYLTVRGHITTAGAATVDLQIATGDEISQNVAITGSISFTSTTETSVDTQIYFPLVGGWNTLWIVMKNVDALGGQTVHITSLAVHQRVKRSH